MFSSGKRSKQSLGVQLQRAACCSKRRLSADKSLSACCQQSSQSKCADCSVSHDEGLLVAFTSHSSMPHHPAA
jgi:hypothetical protein